MVTPNGDTVESMAHQAAPYIVTRVVVVTGNRYHTKWDTGEKRKTSSTTAA